MKYIENTLGRLAFDQFEGILMNDDGDTEILY